MAATMASSSMVQMFGVEFLQRYDVGEKIGKGFYASVFRCIRRSDGAVFAVKSIDVRPLRLRENFSRERLMREVIILQRLDHPSIIQLVEATWNNSVGGDHLLLVMEYAPGQELFDAIITNGKFAESDAREIIAQLVSALRYCHDRDIVHRDVKPENILLVSSDILRRTGSSGQSEQNESAKKANNSKFVVKLLDFGLSRTVGSSGAQTFAGTPEYFAPEVDPRTRTGGARGAYGVAADCWSLGAVIFVMLSGVFPEFTGEGASRQISFGRESYWGHISGHAKNLIGQLMHPDPNQRITMSRAAQHPWLKDLVFRHEKGRRTKTGSSETVEGGSSGGSGSVGGGSGGGGGGGASMTVGTSGLNGTSEDSDGSPRSRVAAQMENCSLGQPSNDGSGGGGGGENGENGRGDVQMVNENAVVADDSSSTSSATHGEHATSVGDKRARDSPSSSTSLPTNGAGPDTMDELGDKRDDTPGDLADVRLGADAIAFLETDHLYMLQDQLAVLFHEAYVTYVSQGDSSMMSTIRMHAIECRQLFKASGALMNKLGGTADNVMNLLPDLRAGVEENEPEFAAHLFEKIKGWIGDLKSESKQMMDNNSRVIRELNISMENAKQGLLESVTTSDVMGRSPNSGGVSHRMLMGVVETASPMVEVMRPRGQRLFGKDGSLNMDGIGGGSASSGSGSRSRGNGGSRRSGGRGSGGSGSGLTTDISEMGMGGGVKGSEFQGRISKETMEEPEFEEVRSAASSPVHRAHSRPVPSALDTTLDDDPLEDNTTTTKECTSLVCTPPRSPAGGSSSSRKQQQQQQNTANTTMMGDGGRFRQRVQHLQSALAKLTQVDRILGGFSMFWDHMETAVTLLSQKNDHVESLLSVTKNPKLKQRFFTRLNEYSHMWKAVALASKRYQSSEASASVQHAASTSQQYQAIENGVTATMSQPSFEDRGSSMEIEEMPSL